MILTLNDIRNLSSSDYVQNALAADHILKECLINGEILELVLPSDYTLTMIPGSSRWAAVAHKITAGDKILKDRFH